MFNWNEVEMELDYFWNLVYSDPGRKIDKQEIGYPRTSTKMIQDDQVKMQSSQNGGTISRILCTCCVGMMDKIPWMKMDL